MLGVNSNVRSSAHIIAYVAWRFKHLGVFFPPTIILTGAGTGRKNTDSEEEERRARGEKRERGLRQRDMESCAIGQLGRRQKLQMQQKYESALAKYVRCIFRTILAKAAAYISEKRGTQEITRGRQMSSNVVVSSFHQRDCSPQERYKKEPRTIFLLSLVSI
ncbi:uncharacterized protein LOC116848991 isoform X2 [Odontomachus brunneus]|uniref:uncharacterized protein LOC116848991 isoform X2 n=1 Tax=Odontomachus brunneus TaxID=486640 RepID=UPI0013F1868B|nr:uncharacterized protein LOC116848991 isoform X2 [Odontomachus brunneus]